MIKEEAGSQSCDRAEMYKLSITLLSESSCYGNTDRDGTAVKESCPESKWYWLNELFFRVEGAKRAGRPTVKNGWRATLNWTDWYWVMLSESLTVTRSPWPCVCSIVFLGELPLTYTVNKWHFLISRNCVSETDQTSDVHNPICPL